MVKISMLAIGICVSTAVLAGCSGHAAVIPTQTQAGNQVEIAQPPNGAFDRSAPPPTSSPPPCHVYITLSSQWQAN